MSRHFVRSARRTIAGVLICLGTAGHVHAQALAPAGTGGVVALADALMRASGHKRVLVIGAHPDDEDNSLISLLSRGWGANVAYLSLTRGEGGQNLVGPELGPALGLLRSEELLAARAVDGASQFFTRAYDFGYSRTAEESFHHWPRTELLGDVIGVIRRFRPQVVVSVFSGTPRDGHGHHQVAGLLARQAYEAVQDSAWGPEKLYRLAGSDPQDATLRLGAGTLDPAVGRSYYQIAMAARSRHRSQDMGQLQRLGPHEINLVLVAARRRAGADDGFFAGVDTTPAGGLRVQALLDSARAALDPKHPEAVIPLIAHALTAVAPDDPARGPLERALVIAAGVIVDPLADDDIVTAGQRVQVEVSVWNAGGEAVEIEAVDLVAPRGWGVQRLEPAPATLRRGALVTRRFAVQVARDAARTEPYFLRRPRRGDLYDWSDTTVGQGGQPFEPPPLEARVRLRLAGTTVTVAREVVQRIRDQAIGEVRRPVAVTQPFDVEITPREVVWPVSGLGAGPRKFTVTVTNRTRGPGVGIVEVTAPSGWVGAPPRRLDFTREDERQSTTITLTPPPGVVPGHYAVRASVVGPRGQSSGSLHVIDYPYIRPRAYSESSTVDLHMAELSLPPLSRIGYIRGAADHVPEALRAAGLPIELLPADSLGEDLSGFDAIVVGSRAYEVDTGLVARNAHLLDYARAGGLVLVQYQQYPFVQGRFAPFPLTIARPHDRVTDETAPVTLLTPDSPVFRSPNAIGPADWDGWVQERGLYFAHSWDSAYTPVIEVHDPGSEPMRGGLLVAPLGSGAYIYTGLSFFRQLPAGVVGAYRLFANLLALALPDVH